VGTVTIVGGVCFAKGESTATQNPASWYAAGFCSVGVLTLVGACLTLARRRWREVALFAAIVASVVSLAIFSFASDSASRSCNNMDQPQSAGTYDCDTGYGLGVPIMLVGFFVPAFVISGLGKLGATGVRRLRS
jgi:hypothetical protein